MDKEKVLVVRTNICMKAGEMQDLQRIILKQKQEGVVLLPHYCEVLYADDSEIVKDIAVISRNTESRPIGRKG